MPYWWLIVLIDEEMFSKIYWSRYSVDGSFCYMLMVFCCLLASWIFLCLFSIVWCLFCIMWTLTPLSFYIFGSFILGSLVLPCNVVKVFNSTRLVNYFIVNWFYTVSKFFSSINCWLVSAEKQRLQNSPEAWYRHYRPQLLLDCLYGSLGLRSGECQNMKHVYINKYIYIYIYI